MLRDVNRQMKQCIVHVKKKKGIWLLEILISVTIMALAAATVALVFNRSLYFYRAAADKNKASQDAQIASEWLVRDLLGATCIYQANADSILFNNEEGEIKYYLQNAQSPYNLVRSLNSVDYLLIDNAESLNFKYFDTAHQEGSVIDQVESTLTTCVDSQKFNLYTVTPVLSYNDCPFAKAYGRLGPDWSLQAVQGTSDGGCLISGIIDNAATNRDIVLIKTDGAGTQEWANAYGTANLANSNEWAGAVIELASKTGYVFSGQTKTFLSDNPQGSANSILVRVNNAGGYMWGRAYRYTDTQRSLKEVSSGFITVGRCYAFGPPGMAGFDDQCFAIKTDSNGRAGNGFAGTWVKQYSLKNEGTQGLFIMPAFDDSGYLILAKSITTADEVIIKTDSDGNIGPAYAGTWVKRYVNFGNVVDFKQTASGDILVLSTSTTVSGHGSNELLLTKLNSNGETGGAYAGTWSIVYGSSGSDTAWSLDFTNDGAYILYGSTTSQFGSGSSANKGLCIKTNSQGEVGDAFSGTWAAYYTAMYPGGVWVTTGALLTTLTRGYLTGGLPTSFSEMALMKIGSDGGIGSCSIDHAITGVDITTPITGEITFQPLTIATAAESQINGWNGKQFAMEDVLAVEIPGQNLSEDMDTETLLPGQFVSQDINPNPGENLICPQ